MSDMFTAYKTCIGQDSRTSGVPFGLTSWLVMCCLCTSLVDLRHLAMMIR